MDGKATTIGENLIMTEGPLVVISGPMANPANGRIETSWHVRTFNAIDVSYDVNMLMWSIRIHRTGAYETYTQPDKSTCLKFAKAVRASVKRALA